MRRPAVKHLLLFLSCDGSKYIYINGHKITVTTAICLQMQLPFLLSKQTWCLTSTETIRLSRDGRKGVWRWRKREIIIIPITILSSPEWLLHYDGQRWEAFLCFINCDGQSHKPVSTNHVFEEKGEPKWNRAKDLLHTSLTLTAGPNRLTGWASSSRVDHSYTSLPSPRCLPPPPPRSLYPPPTFSPLSRPPSPLCLPPHLLPALFIPPPPPSPLPAAPPPPLLPRSPSSPSSSTPSSLSFQPLLLHSFLALLPAPPPPLLPRSPSSPSSSTPSSLSFQPLLLHSFLALLPAPPPPLLPRSPSSPSSSTPSSLSFQPLLLHSFLALLPAPPPPLLPRSPSSPSSSTPSSLSFQPLLLHSFLTLLPAPSLPLLSPYLGPLSSTPLPLLQSII